MKISKKKLLYLIKENLEEMAMDFDTPDRPDQGIQSKLASGDTPLKKVPLPSTNDPNKNFQELLASERYKQVISKVRQYTGLRTPLTGGVQSLMPLASMMMNAHNTIIETERNYRTQLEELAIELVKKEMAIPEGAIRFKAKIVGLGEIDVSDFNREMQNQQNIDPVDIEKNLMSRLEKIDLEKAKRRLINSMIQGASKKGHYMYHYAAEKIREITGSANLIDQYGILMSINDTFYWQLSDNEMKMMMGAGGEEPKVGGKEKVDRNTKPPTIYAEGVNFPVLVHELIKGVLELFAIQGRPEGDEDYSEVEQSEDTLEKEVWDLRLGPAIWERIRAQFPEEILIDENKIELQNYLLVEIFKLPAKEFLVLMKEVISGSQRGKNLINTLMDGINKMFNDQDYDDSMSEFRQDLDYATDETEEGDLNDFLKSIGIQGNINDEDDEDDDDEGGELVPVKK